MAGERRKSARSRFDSWLKAHEALACVLVGVSCAAALAGLFLFMVFGGFGASADFICNQF